MPLEYQLAAVKLTQGLDTRTQQKLVVPGKWNKLDNLSLSDDQTPRRRDGVTNLVAGRTGNSLATHNSQLLAIAGGDVYSVSKALSTASQVAGKAGYVGVSKREVFGASGQQDNVDVAVGSTSGQAAQNLACYVWCDYSAGGTPAGANVCVVDESTGALLMPSTQMRSGTTFCPRVVFCPNIMQNGGTFYVFYTVATILYARAITTAAPSTLGAEQTIFSSVNFVDLQLDCCAFGTDAGGNTTAMVVYHWADGVSSFKTVKIGLTAGVPAVQGIPTILASQADLATVDLLGACCIPLTSTLAAAFSLSAGGNYVGTKGYTINNSWVVQNRGTLDATPTVGNCAITAVADATGTKINVFSDSLGSFGTNSAIAMLNLACDNTMALTNIGGGLWASTFANGATDPAGPQGPFIAGKAFTSGGRIFLPVWMIENYAGLAATKTNNNQQNSWFLMDCGINGIDPTPRMTVVAKALYGSLGMAGVGGGALSLHGCVSSTPSTGAGEFVIALTERSILSTVAGYNVSPTGIARIGLTPNATAAIGRTQLGETTYLAGGQLNSYDGVQTHEALFHLFPEGINVAVTAGGAMTAGTHQVVAVYEFTDNAGRRYQSAPSLPVSGTTGANATLTVRVPTLHVSQLVNGGSTSGGIYVVLYVTQAGGLSFNRAGGSTLATIGGTLNDASVAYVTMTIVDADATLAANELLYTQPNQASSTLPSLAPPPCDAVWGHGNRLFFNQADQRRIGYSQPDVNNLGLQFNPSLSLGLPIDGGDFKAGAELDEKNIVFCSRKLFVSFGTGPNAAGNYSNYSDLQEIPSDVGCSDPRSVVRIPDGLIFKSQKGFYLLGRDLTVRYIGAGVAAFDSYAITSAVMMENQQECRFGTDNSTHPQLIYSYLDGGQWSTNSYLDTYTTRDALYWPTQAQYVAIDGTYGVQTDWGNKFDSFSGTSRGIVWTARTSFLHLAEIGGFQRLRWLLLTGTAQGPSQQASNSPNSTLGVSVYLNDVYGTAAYTFSIALGSIIFPAPTEAVDLRHKIEQQKGKSYAFQFIDTPTANDGQNRFQVDGIQALTLEVGLRRGTFKLSAGQGVS